MGRVGRTWPGCERIFIVSMPARMARGLPLRVPAWYMLPAGATCSMISFLPAYAPTLPKQRARLRRVNCGLGGLSPGVC